LISGLARSAARTRKIPQAKANSENTPMLARTARKAMVYCSALLPPSIMMAPSVAISATATSSTIAMLPPRSTSIVGAPAAGPICGSRASPETDPAGTLLIAGTDMSCSVMPVSSALCD
jgi:hypothetical protein